MARKISSVSNVLLTLVFVCVIDRVSAQTRSGLFRSHRSYDTMSALPAVDTAVMDSTLVKYYRCWKKVYIVPIQDSAEAYIRFNDKDQRNFRCTSEAMGYGMNIVALMAKCDDSARYVYDALFNYWRLHKDGKNTGMMGWAQLKAGGANNDKSAASDGDIDIAYSMLLAAKEWDSPGQFNYKAEADSLIDRIMRVEVNHDTWTILLGDDEEHRQEERRGSMHDRFSDDYFKTRSSDFMPATFRSFYAERHDDRWLKVVDASYALFAKMVNLYSPQNGLVPDFISDLNRIPKPGGYSKEDHPDRYFNNACRVPWRIGLDYLLTGDTSAKARMTLLNDWAASTSNGKPDHIYSGYKLDGTAKSKDNELYYTGPLGVSAMIDRANRPWVTSVWNWLQIDIDYTDGHKPDYFGDNIRMLNMIILSGNYWLPARLK